MAHGAGAKGSPRGAPPTQIPKLIGVMLLQQFGAELVKIIGVLTDNDEHLCRQPVLP